MGKPTENDRIAFNTINRNQKVQALYNYLYVGQNMQEVAKYVFNDSSSHASQRVSVITRCYGFSNRNSGIFRKYDDLEMSDIEAFVKKYPNGCESDMVMRDFIEKRMAEKKRKKNNNSSMQNSVQNNTGFWEQLPQRIDSQQNTYSNSSTNSSNDISEADGCSVMIGIGVALLILYLMRHKILTAIGTILPYVIIIGIGILIVKAVLKGAASSMQGLHFEFSVGGLIWAIIFFYIGYGGMQDGGSFGVALIFFLIGLAGIVKRG